MAKAARKKSTKAMIVFSRARDIPFNRIRLSDDNVRQTDVEAGLDELTQDIDRREDIVQGLNVRAILDGEGNETGDFETPAGGRRYRSIARLVESGRFPADGLVPCIVKKANAKTSAVDDSFAENTFRRGLHPLDQFKAFKRMVDGGMTTEEVASAYFTTQRYVEQRMALSKVSPVLHEAYAQNSMTLAQLEAFTANPHHERQEQVWDAIKNSHNREPWRIRNMLTETSVPASDKRAVFLGIDAYLAAGGPVLPRYLFEDDEDGWLEDVPLLDRLVAEKLKTIAAEVAAEGWKWIEVSLELPYGHDDGLRALAGTLADLTEEERAARQALRDEYEQLEAEYQGVSDLPEEIDQRLGSIETELEAFERRPIIYDPTDIACAGAFISVDQDGDLVIDRGYVRPEDEAPVVVGGEVGAVDADPEGGVPAVAAGVQRAVITLGGQPAEPEEEEDDNVIKPLPERLVIELTAHRTLALRNQLAENPHIALTALLHRLVQDAFHYGSLRGCLEASVRKIYLSAQEAGLKDSPSAKAIEARKQAWQQDIPLDDDDRLWDWLNRLEDASRLALLAHCVSYGVNALFERPNPFSGSGITQSGLDRRFREADRLANATGLDMVDAGWRPTVENYLGRVTKPRILEAVREGAGDRAAELIHHLKKADMAEQAQRLLAETGWLPEPLRLLAIEEPVADQRDEDGSEVLPTFLSGDEPDADDIGIEYDQPHMVAAE